MGEIIFSSFASAIPLLAKLLLPILLFYFALALLGSRKKRKSRGRNYSKKPKQTIHSSQNGPWAAPIRESQASPVSQANELNDGLKPGQSQTAQAKKQDEWADEYSVTLYPKQLINSSEQRLFDSLHNLIAKHDVKAYVFSQVSYGEIIGCRGKDAFRAFSTFNSRRADFVVTDLSFNTLAVIEYHGEGHFNGADMIKSDQTKQAICAGAGINLLIVHYREKGRLTAYLEEHLLPILKTASIELPSIQIERHTVS